MKKVAIYGDSILKGVMLNPDSKTYYIGGKELIESFQKDYPLEIANSARFGYTVTRGYSQFQKDLKKGINFDAIILEYGGNDCDFNWVEIANTPEQDHFPKTTLEEFKSTYKKLIREIKSHGIIPIITAMPPIDANKYIKWICRNGINLDNILKWLGNVNRIYRFQEMYAHTVQKIAYEENCPFVDVRSEFLAEKDLSTCLCEDGIHPNIKGHKIIIKAFEKLAKSMHDIINPKIQLKE